MRVVGTDAVSNELARVVLDVKYIATYLRLGRFGKPAPLHTLSASCAAGLCLRNGQANLGPLSRRFRFGGRFVVSTTVSSEGLLSGFLLGTIRGPFEPKS